jgi:SAM-dependent methyltransferase
MDELPATAQALTGAVVARGSVRMLVAGCGTGQEPILLAAEQSDASVLAVDLSLASLAYAQRMARRLNVQNVTFCQADILQLDALEETFDIVVCSGVLHHMKEPAAGLRQLVRRLQPQGLLKIALYSERARDLVRDARQIIGERRMAPDEQSIRAFRHEVFGLDEAHPLKRLSTWRDFYSLSTCRDLLFHAQEHRYRLPQMLALLREAGLTPLCMTALPHAAQLAFRQQFPGADSKTDFQRWDEFEALQPRTFLGMYHLWCKRA